MATMFSPKRAALTQRPRQPLHPVQSVQPREHESRRREHRGCTRQPRERRKWDRTCPRPPASAACACGDNLARRGRPQRCSGSRRTSRPGSPLFPACSSKQIRRPRDQGCTAPDAVSFRRALLSRPEAMSGVREITLYISRDRPRTPERPPIVFRQDRQHVQPHSER